MMLNALTPPLHCPICLLNTVSPSSRLVSSVIVGGSIPMHRTSCPYIYSDEFCTTHLETEELMSHVRNNLEEAFRKRFEVYFCFNNSGSIKDKMNWLAVSCKHFKEACWHILTDKWCSMSTWTKPFGCNWEVNWFGNFKYFLSRHRQRKRNTLTT